MTPAMAMIVSTLDVTDDSPLSTIKAIRCARIGACGTGFGFGNAWRRVCAMATSPSTRLALGTGGSILKPPAPGAIGGLIVGAIGDSAGDGGGVRCDASNFRSSMPSASISSFGPDVRFQVVLPG